MTTIRLLNRRIAAMLFSAATLSLAAGAFAADTGDTPAAKPQQQSFQQRRHDMIATRLAQMANRLEIKPSQQDAWNTYSTTVESLAETPRQLPPRDADAATLLHFKADRLAEMSQHLNKLADATATLAKALTPEQRSVLNEMARQERSMGRAKAPRARGPGQ